MSAPFVGIRVKDGFKLESDYADYLMSLPDALDARTLKQVIGTIATSEFGKRPRGSASIKTTPLAYSGEYDWHVFLNKLIDSLLDAGFYVSDVDETGAITGDAIQRDFAELRTLGGYMMNPLGTPRLDAFRREVPLDKPFEQILTTVAKLALSEFEVTPLTINKISSMGFPYFTNSIATKLQMLQRVFAVAPEFFGRVADKDYAWMLENTWTLPVASITRRNQVDVVLRREPRKDANLEMKDRRVFDWTGKEHIADKSTPFDGFLSQRVRTAWASQSTINSVFQMVMQGYRTMYLRKFPFVWHHTSSNDILAKVKQYKFMLGLDVSQFDQSIPLNWMHMVIDQMGQVSDEYKEGCKSLLAVPLLIQADIHGESGCYLINKDDYSAGLPSGIFFVSDMGKIIGLSCVLMIAYLTKLIKFKTAEECEEQILMVMKGKHPRIGVLNSGDDNLTLFNRESDMKAYVRALQKFDLMKFGVESPVSFLGNIFRRDTSGLHILPNINTFLSKLLCPERPFGHKVHRPFAASGALDRKRLFMAHPRFEKIDRILNDVHSSCYGVSFDQMMRKAKSQEDQERPQGINLIDTAFMNDPSIIHYKVDPSQVSPHVLEQYYAVLEYDQVAPIIDKLLNRS